MTSEIKKLMMDVQYLHIQDAGFDDPDNKGFGMIDDH